MNGAGVVGEAVVDGGDVAMIPMPLVLRMALEVAETGGVDGAKGDADALGGSEEDKNEEVNDIEDVVDC